MEEIEGPYLTKWQDVVAVVSLLTFYFDDPSFSPAEVYDFDGVKIAINAKSGHGLSFYAYKLQNIA